MADRPINSRTLGRVVAISLGLVFLGIVGLVVVYHGATGSRPLPTAPAPSKDSAPQDIATTGLSPVGKARFQYVDKADPSKVLGLIEWAKIDPQPLGRSIVERPKATLFLSPAARIVVTADKGTLIARPSEPKPESGVFEGNVTARYFIVPPTVSGTPAPLPSGAVPAIEFSTTSIAFDLPLGEITSAGSFTLIGSGIDAAGSGVRIVANEVQSRIELFKVDKTTKLVLSPSKLRTLADSLQSSTRMPSQDAPAAAPQITAPVAALPAKQTLYRTSMGPELSIRSASIDLTAQRLEAFTTAIDGKIAPGAIAPLTMLSSAAKPARGEDALTPTPSTNTNPRLLTPFVLGSDATPWDSVTPADDISVSFSGPLEVRPITAMPTELRGQLAGVRIFGDRTVATLSIKPAMQPQSPTATVTFGEAWYSATTPRLVLTRSAEPVRAIIRQAQYAIVQCEKLSSDLVSGRISLIGPGFGATDAESNRREEQTLVGPQLMRTLVWSDQLDVGMLIADGRISQQILAAIAQGDVRITDQRGTVSSGVVKLDFKELSRRAGEAPATALARISLTEKARLEATNAADGTLSGEAITIDLAPTVFASRQNALEIRQVLTVGTQSEPAAATRRGLKLQAGLIDAKLQNDELGKTALRAVHAENQVAFTDDRDTFARADRLDVASADSQVIDLSGTTVSIGRGGKEQGGIEISGTQMRLDGLRRELYVHGPGRMLAFPKPAASSGSTAAGTTLETVWTEFLRFDDDKGNAEARGSTVAVARRGTGEANTMRAEALKLTFEPRLNQTPALQAVATTAAAVVAGAAPVTQQFGSERKILLVEAIGRSVSQTGAPKATVEIRRFGPQQQGAEGPLEQLLFLEGDRILASPAKATLEVPGPGQLLVDDHRQPRTTPALTTAAAAPNTAAVTPATDTLFNPSRAGTSLFTWTGSLMFNQAEGLMQMRDGIRLLQRARGADAPVSLTSELIEARLRPLPTAAVTPPPAGSDAALAQQLGGELVSAAAAINVEVVTPDGKRLNAGRVEFDAAQQIIAAYGDTTANLAPQPITADPARVTFVEPTKPSPLVARALRWFVKSGRIEVIEPMPVSGSR